ncbi:MAG: UpxY family transcription antiterminator [Syntrophaceae bacterium]|nr:UpxY family transcription antiterminator [Syntrophaceae bacterium]
MPWYAIHTRSRHEDKVCLGLTQKAVHAFLPKMEVWSKRKDRRKKIPVPMFPGYLFAETAEMDNRIRLDILKTSGVVRILGRPNSQEPIPVPDETIDAIQRLVVSRVEIQQIQYPKVGERACIIDGPFQGIEGIVLKADYQQELFVVSIELLQRSVAIRLEGFQVAKI